ncbi:ATP-binding protein [Corynebacterium lactis]|uniref:ATPase AAA n=1 Tax=Corynebacterium lactis RW2-5 TaxID=1408189 RepID=A0A0K2H0D8_9CORY|nr:ATP-binding protein [Corynebacterium lactis]ALA67505.1 ATPase AAA [Corynebacterium lactis RW2-5]
MDQLLSRNSALLLAELTEHFPAVEVLGARQVGKSTLTKQVSDDLARAGTNVLSFTMDDPETRSVAASDPRGFLSQNPAGMMVIDEFQRVPELILPLKAEIDRLRRPGRFLITGSSKMTTGEAAADSLAGRVTSLQIRGFSQGELLGVKEDFVARVLADFAPANEASALTRSDYVDIIWRGSMPEAQQLSDRMRQTWMKSYISRLLSRDIQELAKIRQPEQVMALLRALAAVQGSETIVGRLANDLNIAAGSAAQYLRLLEGLFLVDLLPPWTPNLLKREVGRHKSVISDPGLGLWLTGAKPAILKDLVKGQSFGGFLEAFVASELLRQKTWASDDWELFHYRSPDGREIDLVIELDDGRVIALEVKAASSVAPGDYRHLAWLREKLGDRFVAGYVLTTDTHGRLLGDRLAALPVAALWSPTPSNP